nr:concanavalin A-like lectin/glucanase, subgroup [Tanacetum cinerariifolium]
VRMSSDTKRLGQNNGNKKRGKMMEKHVTTVFDTSCPIGTPAQARVENSFIKEYKDFARREYDNEEVVNIKRPDFPTPICDKLKRLGMANNTKWQPLSFQMVWGSPGLSWSSDELKLYGLVGQTVTHIGYERVNDHQSIHKSDNGDRNCSSSILSLNKRCRVFSLAEIKLATHDFDDALVIGRAGLVRLNIFIGAARGLDYLHTGTGVESRVIHHDVKSSNVLLDEKLAAKISHFGEASLVTWMSSIFSAHRLTRKSDVYAFDVVLLETLCGRHALNFTLDEQQHSLSANDQKRNGRTTFINKARLLLSTKAPSKFKLFCNVFELVSIRIKETEIGFSMVMPALLIYLDLSLRAYLSVLKITLKYGRNVGDFVSPVGI